MRSFDDPPARRLRCWDFLIARELGSPPSACYDYFMSAVTSYRHIVKHLNAPAHLEDHPRTRVAMIVMDYLGRGLGPEDIVRHYTYLSLAEVHSAMAYYHDHREEIDGEIREELASLSADLDANARSELWKRLKATGIV
jgi:uncharacterized protein (DUF433 family)